MLPDNILGLDFVIQLYIKAAVSLVEVEWHYGKNESSIHSVVLNSVHPELLSFFSMVVTLEPYICEYKRSSVLRHKSAPTLGDSRASS
jgi:hypothetical protein